MFFKKRCSQKPRKSQKRKKKHLCFATLLKSHFGVDTLLQICCTFSEHVFSSTPLKCCFCLAQVFSCEFCESFKKTFLIEHLWKIASKAKFFFFFSLSFSSFGNYRLNWKCEYMKRYSWKFPQISCRFLTFTWFNEYFEWVDRYMNFLPLRTKVYSIFEFVVG